HDSRAAGSDQGGARSGRQRPGSAKITFAPYEAGTDQRRSGYSSSRRLRGGSGGDARTRGFSVRFRSARYRPARLDRRVPAFERGGSGARGRAGSEAQPRADPGRSDAFDARRYGQARRGGGAVRRGGRAGDAAIFLSL